MLIQPPQERRLRDGRLIVDELCACGLRFSQHSPLVVQDETGEPFKAADGSIVAEEGHGDAVGCEQFTWVAFILEDGNYSPPHPENDINWKERHGE
jgi:hypothetical protein